VSLQASTLSNEASWQVKAVSGFENAGTEGYWNAKTWGCRLCIQLVTRRGYPWDRVDRTRMASDQKCSPRRKSVFSLQNQRSSSWPSHLSPSHFWRFFLWWKRI